MRIVKRGIWLRRPPSLTPLDSSVSIIDSGTARYFALTELPWQAFIGLSVHFAQKELLPHVEFSLR